MCEYRTPPISTDRSASPEVAMQVFASATSRCSPRPVSIRTDQPRFPGGGSPNARSPPRSTRHAVIFRSRSTLRAASAASPLPMPPKSIFIPSASTRAAPPDASVSISAGSLSRRAASSSSHGGRIPVSPALRQRATAGPTLIAKALFVARETRSARSIASRRSTETGCHTPGTAAAWKRRISLDGR
jgi:hypothetical protein